MAVDTLAMYGLASSFIKLIASVAVALGMLLPGAHLSAAEKYYKSRAKDGSTVFSDAPMRNGKLVRTSYTNHYGKPMATASCNGVSLQIMAARATHIEAELLAAATAHQVDPLLVKAIARVESCFDPHAVSVAGARGLMQLMPETAAELQVTDSFNELQNLMGGSQYIARMLKQFDGDLDLALAAYNAGPGNVRRYNGIPPFNETQRYVEQVRSHYKLFSAAKQP